MSGNRPLFVGPASWDKVGLLRSLAPSPWRLGYAPLDQAWNSIPADPSPRQLIAHFPGIRLDERREKLRAFT